MDLSVEDKYLVAFSTVPGIGPARLKLLLEYFGSAQSAWLAPRDELAQTGLSKDALIQLLDSQQKLIIDKYIENIQSRGIKVLTVFDKSYPGRLKNIQDPPNALFIKSNLSIPEITDLTSGKIIGVIGTRKMTSYGREITEKITTDLVIEGFTITSGMAIGIDGVAHGTAINAGGKTIAVLGAGVDIIYPRQHRDLYHSILDHGGAIVSEVAPDKTVARGVFPARNRIISGLSEAVLVTEGAIDSGSLITARAALDQGREVFAIPGPINSPMAEGTNYLLKQGAKLVTDISDILETLGYKAIGASKASQIPKPVGGSPEEQKIIDLLSVEDQDFDELVRQTKIPSSQLGSLLSTMELAGKIKNHALRYSLA